MHSFIPQFIATLGGNCKYTKLNKVLMTINISSDLWCLQFGKCDSLAVLCSAEPQWWHWSHQEWGELDCQYIYVGSSLGALVSRSVLSTDLYNYWNPDMTQWHMTRYSNIVYMSESWIVLRPVVNNYIPLSAVTFPIIGKKWSLVALAIPFIGGWFLLCFAKSLAMLLIGR